MPRTGKHPHGRTRRAGSVAGEAEPQRPPGEDLYATLGARFGCFRGTVDAHLVLPARGSLTRCALPLAATGVPRDASTEDIKRAYKLLALRHHPDKAGEDAAAVGVFQRVSFAYSVLSDARKKRYYDDTGVLVPSTSASEHSD